MSFTYIPDITIDNTFPGFCTEFVRQILFLLQITWFLTKIGHTAFRRRY